MLLTALLYIVYKHILIYSRFGSIYSRTNNSTKILKLSWSVDGRNASIYSTCFSQLNYGMINAFSLRHAISARIPWVHACKPVAYTLEAIGNWGGLQIQCPQINASRDLSLSW